MTRAAVGWADLLQVLDALPEGRWNEAADALGFQPREDRHPQPPQLPLPVPPGERPPEPAPPPAQPEPAQVQSAAEQRQVFWRVASDLPDPEAITEAPAWFTRTDLPDASVFQSAPDVAAPSRRPLARPAQLAAFFRRHLAFERPSAEPDLRRLLRHIVRQQPLRRWPLRLRRRWPARVHLVYDRSPALQPLHDDLAPIARQLHRLLGPRLNLLLAEGSPGSLRDSGERPARLPTDGASVVLLGDAGLLSAGSDAAQTWSHWSARRESTGRRPLILAPLPRARVDALLSRHADVCPLDAPGSLRLSTVRPFGPTPVGQNCALLRAALFGNSFVTPVLLRDLRLTLQRAGHPLDVATEAALWRDPAVGASSVACTLLPAQREAAARDFRQWPAELREAIASVHWQHLQSASPLVRAEYVRWLRPELPDTSSLAAVFDEALRDAEQLMQQACVAMRADPVGLGHDLAAYVGRLGHRSPRLIEMGDDALQAAWLLAQREALQQGQLRPLPSLRQDKLAWLLDQLPELGKQLVLCIEGCPVGDPPRPAQQLVLRAADGVEGSAVLASLGRALRVEWTPRVANWSEILRPRLVRLADEVAQFSSRKLAAVVAAVAMLAGAEPDGAMFELRWILSGALTSTEARQSLRSNLLAWGSKWLLSHSMPSWIERLSAKMRSALKTAAQSNILDELLAVIDDWQENPKPIELLLDRPFRLPSSRAFEISTGFRSWRVEPFLRPEWATALTLERDHWQARVPDGRWLTWVPQRRIRKLALPGGESVSVYETHSGAWWDPAVEVPFFTAPDSPQYPIWAARSDLDEYGLWAEFDIPGRAGTITQRLRWIPPGEFWMGSSEAEFERNSMGDRAETLHRVVLTQGYWLADTACTQALWEAVLGENPSVFKEDPSNPVEQVSWNDVKEKFLPTLNRLVPRLEAELPSEAQWEYACRAGTQTPFWFGERITPEQVNYDGNFPYAGGKKGQYREKTVPVKSLPANGWGLYEMHGNVYEWCEDELGKYPNDAVVDPIGHGGGSEGRQRVLRGGCWYGLGCYCRSAYRGASAPDGRYREFGFRLARGSGVPPPAGPGAGGAGGAAGGAR